MTHKDKTPYSIYVIPDLIRDPTASANAYCWILTCVRMTARGFARLNARA